MYWDFVIVFLLFLSKNLFSLNLFLVIIYGMNFIHFLRFCFHESLRITKLIFGQSFVFL
jgi:hypothetical protein